MNVLTDPFPYCILDGRWDSGMLLNCRDSFPPPDADVWRRFENGHERKFGSTGTPSSWPNPVQRMVLELTDPEFCNEIAASFGIEDELFPDLYGGGMHMIPPGGVLDVHVDFNIHPTSVAYRRINCLVYLNDWHPGMGGELELRSERDEAHLVVEPVFNRTVIFATSDHSWHGHPNPTADGFWRKSIACYYYTERPAPGFHAAHDTVFWED